MRSNARNVLLKGGKAKEKSEGCQLPNEGSYKSAFSLHGVNSRQGIKKRTSGNWSNGAMEYWAPNASLQYSITPIPYRAGVFHLTLASASLIRARCQKSSTLRFSPFS